MARVMFLTQGKKGLGILKKRREKMRRQEYMQTHTGRDIYTERKTEVKYSEVRFSVLSLCVAESPSSVEVVDGRGDRTRGGLLGPYREGSSLSLTCIAKGGQLLALCCLSCCCYLPCSSPHTCSFFLSVFNFFVCLVIFLFIVLFFLTSLLCFLSSVRIVYVLFQGFTVFRSFSFAYFFSHFSVSVCAVVSFGRVFSLFGCDSFFFQKF